MPFILPANPVKLFTTGGSEYLAKPVGALLKERLNPELRPDGEGCESSVTFKWFSNQNVEARVEDVRGRIAVVIHTQVPPVSDRLMELFSLLHALKNARAEDIMVVFPYMPYARSDRKDKPRISVMAQWLAQTISRTLGIQRVILLDPHETHVKHYFEPTADEITSIYLIIDHLRQTVMNEHSPGEVVVVYADAGAAHRYKQVASLLGVSQAYIDKGHAVDSTTTEVHAVVGNVKNKVCILIDDEGLTGGTALKDVTSLLSQKARSIIMAFPHAVLRDNRETDPNSVIKKLDASPIERFIVTDSVPIVDRLEGTSKFEVLSITGLLAEAVKRMVQNDSLTFLHDPKNVGIYRV